MSVCSAACRDDLPLDSSVTNKNQVNTLEYPLVQSIRNSYPDKMGYHFTEAISSTNKLATNKNK